MFLQSPAIISYPVLDSTMDAARRLLDAPSTDEQGCMVILADAQCQGRGRRQRSWWSPPGNFYASFVMPWLHPYPILGQMSFVYGVAIIEALTHYLLPSSHIQCKWPNDILINNAKAGGILLETHTSSQSKTLFLIAGVGINVITAPHDTQGQLAATYMQAHADQPIIISNLLDKCLTALQKWYDCWCAQGFTPIRKAWLEWADAQGKKVTVRLQKHGDPMEGWFIDLDESGALVFETPSGQRHAIYAGDVFFDDH